MAGSPGPEISIFTADDVASHLRELGALLQACVQGGASISFVLPFAAEDAEAFWRDTVLPAVRGGGLLLLVDQPAKLYSVATGARPRKG